MIWSFEKVDTLYTKFGHALDYNVRYLCVIAKEKQVVVNFGSAKEEKTELTLIIAVGLIWFSH